MRDTNGKYEDLGGEIGALVDRKNAAYGDSFNHAAEVLTVLYPRGVKLTQYKDMLATVRIIDKLFRVANHKHAFGESPWRDIAGYGLLGASNDMKE